MLSIWRICTRNDKKITWTFLVLKAWCDTKQENCNEPSPSLVLSIWRICTRNNKKVTWAFLVLKASRFDPFSYPPCSPSCVSQIDFPVSRIDYTTDDSSRIDSNRVDLTTFPTLLVRLFVWFFLSVLQIDFPVRLHNGRFESNWVDSTTFRKCLFFLSVSQIISTIQLVEPTTQRTIRVELTRIESIRPLFLPSLFAFLCDFSKCLANRLSS